MLHYEQIAYFCKVFSFSIMADSGKMKTLAKETAIYGLSSIIGRFLNWCLVPMYTYVLADPSEYGIVTNIYAYTALLLVILTYGMETGFFRFVNKESDRASIVYGTTLFSIGTTSLLFIALVSVFSKGIANVMGYADHVEFIVIMGIVVAIDAFTAIGFAYLRYKKQAVRFAAFKLLMIFINIFFNIFFLIICPWIWKNNPDLISWFYNPNYGVGYIIIANLISTASTLIMLLPSFFQATFKPDFSLLKSMLHYSLPLLILGIAGIMNQTVDKIIFPYLCPGTDGMRQLGIYGACFKVAMVMMMFTQAFRYAYEPFVFAQHKDKNGKEAYADAMKFFVIFSLLIFLGMIFFIDILKLLIAPSYWEGLRIVPIILASYLFQGVFFNLSLWYKLTDKTQYGAYFSIIGVIITVALNVLLVPHIGYFGSAWASFFCYLVIMIISYFFGQKFFPIDYKLKDLAIYVAVAIVLFAVAHFAITPYAIANYAIRAVLILAFLALIVKRDLPLSHIPVINRFFK